VATSQIWLDERQGIRFSTYAIIDATKKSYDPDSPTKDFPKNCGLANRITQDVGFIPGAVNIYYVNAVDGNPENGATCFANSVFVIAMGIRSSDDLLVHELGHTLLGDGSIHTDCLSTAPYPECPPLPADTPNPVFDRTNVMHSFSAPITRKGLTEGQTFRAIINEGSAINNLYNARPGLITAPHFCGNNTRTTDFDCPPVQKRIWEDIGETDATANVTHWTPN
jgi:hypothetical protein